MATALLSRYLFLASSAAIFRGGSALLFLLILARTWGVEIFGQFAYAFTIANVLGLLVDYGFQIKLLRDLSLNMADVAKIVGRMLAVKGVFIVPSLVVALVSESVGGSQWMPPEVVPLFLAYAFNSISMCLYAPFKVQGRYGSDARMACIDGVLTLVLAVGAGATDLDVASVAWLLATMKLVLAIAAYGEYRAAFPIQWPAAREVGAEVAAGAVFAGHAIVGALYLNADTFVVRAFSDSFSFGVYQAGLRLVIGAGVLLTVINAVFTPRFGRYIDAAQFSLDRELRQVNVVVFLAALVGCLVLWRFGDAFSVLLYGEEFSSLGELLWIFGAIVALRMTGSFYGVVLSLKGRQGMRLLLGLISLLMIVIADIALVPKFGIHAAAVVLLAVHMFIYLAYVLIYRYGRERKVFADA